VAWAFAIAHPELLDKLIVVNAPHPGVFERLLSEDPAQQKASQYMPMFRSPQAEATLSANNYAALVGAVMNSAFTDEDKKAYLEAWSQPGALTGGLNYYRAAQFGPAAHALLPQNLDGLDRFVPRLTIKRIPDGTHWVIHEKPEEINEEIREFIR
jgi:epoxide hydrolase 4